MAQLHLFFEFFFDAAWFRDFLLQFLTRVTIGMVTAVNGQGRVDRHWPRLTDHFEVRSL
jgi:hypothetical protein